MRSQAHRPVHIPAYVVTLVLMIVSAAIVTGVIWFALSLFFSMARYIPSAL